jgi:hypothetical protein
MASGDPPAMSPKPKPSGKPKGRKLSQKEQSERFTEAARHLGIGESGTEFDRAVEVIVRRKPAN